MAADKVHLLLISDVDLILQDFRLFVGIISKEGFQVSDFCGDVGKWWQCETFV